MKIGLSGILIKGRGMFLAYDQGMEHGPTDFNDKNVDPEFIIDIAKKGKFTGMVFQKGIAEKYKKEIKASGVPLIVKLNGKTNLVRGEPISGQLCSVGEAVKLGAAAVGYTIYIGSKFESKMLVEFEKIREEARRRGLPVVVWVYPRGSGVKGKSKRNLMAYAARVGLEIGADIIKIQSTGRRADVEWAVESAGKCKVVVAGGKKKFVGDLIKEVDMSMKAGCVGVAIGRNVWQAKKPLEVARKLRGTIWG